jgi:hypothetical protein
MHWLRNKHLIGNDIDESDLRALANLIAVDLPKSQLTEEKKAQAISEALDWLRNMKANL